MTTSSTNRKVRGIDAPSRERTSEKPSLDGDWLNFCLLVMLYVIQGFPVGLSNALPIILQSQKTVSYEDQAVFSIAVWPYTVKLLWAPIVDAFYLRRLGRRKCWLIPLQLSMAAFLFYMAINVDDWLPESGKPNLKMITTVIFALNFLSATQDVAVDGWSLTMLKKKNVNYASMCSTVGVSSGMFVGFICFILLVSEKFNVKYFGATAGAGGLVSMKNFLYFWVAIVCTTTVAAVLRTETDNRLDDGYEGASVLRTYQLLWGILKLSRVRILATALLTARFGFIATDSISHLKLIDAGVSKDNLMLINTVMFAVKFVASFSIFKYIAGSKPMSYYFKMVPIRLCLCVIYAALLYYTPTLIGYHGSIFGASIYYYYLLLGSVIMANEIFNTFMMMTITAFFCQISDPRFGGLYMTLYNTFFFSGWLVPNTFALKMVDVLTMADRCSTNPRNDCSTSDLRNLCKTDRGTCETPMDGYYIAVFVCITFGFVWYFVFRNVIKSYQSLSLDHWTMNAKRRSDIEGSDVMKESFLRLCPT